MIQFARQAFLAAALVAVAGTPAFAAEWKVDAGHSQVAFEIRHFVSEVPGRFNEFTGAIQYDAAKPADSKVEFTVQAKSIDTANGDRDNHLRSADFFNVEKFPTLSFKSTSVKVDSANQLSVTGDFTMLGVTKSITIPVRILGVLETPRGTKGGFKSQFVIARKDFGMVWNRALDAGGTILGEEVAITIGIEADKVVPEAPKG